MRLHLDWKLIILQLVLVAVVIWLDNAVIDVLFIGFVIWAGFFWAKDNPSATQILGDIRDAHAVDEHHRD